MLGTVLAINDVMFNNLFQQLKTLSELFGVQLLTIVIALVVSYYLGTVIDKDRQNKKTK